jgi:hypothetical protein
MPQNCPPSEQGSHLPLLHDVLQQSSGLRQLAPPAAQVHAPVASQVSGSWHMPQVPPQPLSPQTLGPQVGWQAWHWPVVVSQVEGAVQPGGQLAPQPSGPQLLPPHCV